MAASSTRVLNWGLLSTARINRALIPVLKATKQHRLLAVGSRSGESAETYAREWNIPRAHASYEALLADPEIDVVYISLPNHMHAEWSVRALRGGKHVLCEKPLALSVEEVDRMAAASRETGRVLAEAFMYRHHPQTLKVKELVDSGALGTLQLIRGAFTFDLNRPGDIRVRKETGGGSIWDVGCYPISYARLLAGTDPVEVFGWQDLAGGEVDLSFAGQMRFPNDLFAQFDCGFQSPSRSVMEIVGSEGVLQVAVPFKPGLDEKLLITRGGKTETLKIKGQELYLGEVEDMGEAVLNGRPPRISLADSRGNVATITALLESARSGRAVRL